MYSQVYARPIIITGLDYGTDYTGNNCAGVMKNSQSLPVLFLPSHMAKVAEADETLLAFTLIEVCIKECAAYKFTFYGANQPMLTNLCVEYLRYIFHCQ